MPLGKTLVNVPNAPCGVESYRRLTSTNEALPFLMHRVELKVWTVALVRRCLSRVPNAPCGVESVYIRKEILEEEGVPNAPCGVESLSLTPKPFPSGRFLMHRVELKDRVYPSAPF